MTDTTATFRRRLVDAPMCAYWNEGVRRSLAAEPVEWCQWDGPSAPCYREACKGGMCKSHLGVIAREGRL